MKGTVKWYNAAKGFGFINSDETGEDVFVHYTFVKNRASQDLSEGEAVEFDLVQGKKGLQAENVRVLAGADDQDLEPETDAPLETPDVGVLLVGDRLRLVTVSRDGRYEYIDPLRNRHGLLYLLSSETQALASAVDEFEDLINSETTRELDMQRFFEQNPEFILNDEYKAARAQVMLERSDDEGPLIPDFLLEPVEQGGLCDILEIKRPNVKMFAMKKNRLRFSAAVFEACAQLRTYAAYFDDPMNRVRIRERHGLHAFRPRLFLILGRRGDVEPCVRRAIESDVGDKIAIKSYDDILERVKHRLRGLRRDSRVRSAG